jgi:hypothetical protein
MVSIRKFSILQKFLPFIKFSVQVNNIKKEREGERRG